MRGQRGAETFRGAVTEPDPELHDGAPHPIVALHPTEEDRMTRTDTTAARRWTAGPLLIAAVLAALAAGFMIPAGATGTSDVSAEFGDEPSGVERTGGEVAIATPADPVTVEVTGTIAVDIADLPATIPGPDVTLTLLVNGEEADTDPLLEGTTTVMLDEGTATFEDLSLESPPASRDNYQLLATVAIDEDDGEGGTTSTTLATATSAAFKAWGDIQDCDTTPCNPAQVTDDSNNDVTLALDGPGTQRLGLIGSGASDDPYELGEGCAGDHQRLPRTVLFDTKLDEGDGTALITLTFERGDANQGIGQYEICYVSDTKFKTRSGSPSPQLADDPDFAYGPGLLPDCKGNKPDQEPCIVSRKSLGGSDAVPLGEFVIRVPAGDPMFR